MKKIIIPILSLACALFVFCACAGRTTPPGPPIDTPEETTTEKEQTTTPDVTTQTPETTEPTETTQAPETSAPPPPEYDFDRGTGKVEIEEISIISSATGKPYEGSRFETDEEGEISFYYPLLVSDADVAEAKLVVEHDGRKTEFSLDLTSRNLIDLTDPALERATFLLIAKRDRQALAVMQIYTDEGKPIESKTDYVHATLIIDGVEYGTKIRGRGNSSWTEFPKKSYRLKLDSGAELFGLPKNKDFNLTSNYPDKSLMRNSVAHTVAAMFDGLDFTSVHIPVDLYLNGEYLGIYTFSDKIEEGKGRLDLAAREDEEKNSFGGLDIGFLLEMGWDYDSENVYNRDYFDTDLLYRIYVKDPEIKVANSPEITYISAYMRAAERAIVSDDGWEELIDLDSFVDWFIVTEFTFNTESAFYRSCYLWKRAGGKLMLGPVWDFDMAFGNHLGDIKDYDGWCTTESTYEYISENWMNHLIEYDAFKSAVRARWEEKKEDLLDAALSAVNTYAALLDGSQKQNFLRWDIMDKRVGEASVSPYLYKTYESQVEYLRGFILNRYAYMDERIGREF